MEIPPQSSVELDFMRDSMSMQLGFIADSSMRGPMTRKHTEGFFEGVYGMCSGCAQVVGGSNVKR